MSASVFFIVNARIGSKKIQSLQQAVQQYFANQAHEIHITEYGGHAKILAQQAVKDHYQTVVAVGGDGTVNEVIQALAMSDVALGIVPTGSGNGLARHCSIPLTISEAVKLIADGKLMKIDLGKANDVYFISNAGVGFDAWVCNTIQQTTHRGLKMYILKVIQHYFTYMADTYVIETETGTITQKAFFLNVANGKEFGYGFEIAPEATLQDGYLDLILVKKINAWNGLTFVIDGWRKKLVKNKNCIYIRAKKMNIQGKALRYFQTDGDAHDCNNTCVIEVKPNALNIIVPQHMNAL